MFLLQKSPTHSGAQIAYTNQGLMKTYLKSSLARHEMDDPIALNKQKELDEEEIRKKEEEDENEEENK